MAGGGADRIAELEREVARLSASEAFLRSVLDSAPDFIARIAPDGTVLYINRFAPGFRPEDLVGHSVFEFIAESSHQTARECYARVVASGVPDAYEAMGIGAHNEPTPFFVRVGPIRDGDQVTALTLLLTDVTSMKRVERELRESEAKVRLSVAASGMGLWSWEISDDRMTHDETSRGIAGLGPHEASRSSADMLELVHPEDRDLVRERLAELQAGGAHRPFEYRIVRRDGAIRWVMSQGAALRDDSARTVTVIGGSLDVTQRRAMDEQLRQTQKLEAIGQLTAGIAHNFNNMLTVILPSIDLAMRRTCANPIPLLSDAHDAAERAADLVRQLMLFAGSRRRSLAEATSAVDVVELVERTIAIGRSAFDRRIEVGLTHAARLPCVEIESIQLEQAVLNILLNARVALERTETAPRIDIDIDLIAADAPQLRAQPSALRVDHVRIRVTDNGCGMDEATRRRVFEPFFTTRGEQKGTGIGLAYVFGTIRDAHGFVECASTLGEGSTFTILLPRTEHPVAPRVVSRSPELARGTEHILVVDDDEAVRTAIERVLDEAGYRVATAKDGRDALERFRAPGARFDAVILDQAMPGLPGNAVLPALLAHDPSIKVIGFTGHAEPMPGAHACLAKPLDAAHLLTAIRAVLDRDDRGGAPDPTTR